MDRQTAQEAHAARSEWQGRRAVRPGERHDAVLLAPDHQRGRGHTAEPRLDDEGGHLAGVLREGAQRRLSHGRLAVAIEQAQPPLRAKHEALSIGRNAEMESPVRPFNDSERAKLKEAG